MDGAFDQSSDSALTLKQRPYQGHRRRSETRSQTKVEDKVRDKDEVKVRAKAGLKVVSKVKAKDKAGKLREASIGINLKMLRKIKLKKRNVSKRKAGRQGLERK